MSEVTMNKATVRPIKNSPEITAVEILPGRVVKISWCDAVGAEKYVVKRYDIENGERVMHKLDTVPSSVTSYRDTGIPEDGKYEYRVVAKKKLDAKTNASKSSESAFAEIISLEAPQLSSIKNVGNKIEISWKKDKEAYGFVVLRRFSFMKKATPIATLENGETSFCDDKFAHGRLMYYTIRKIVQSGESFNYSHQSNRLCSVILDAPKILKFKKKLGKKVFASLRITAGADGYIMQRSDDGGKTFFEVERTNSISSFEFLNQLPKGRKEAVYRFACFKTAEEGREFIGNFSEAIQVKF